MKRPGRFVAIVGPDGVGKTSLALALLKQPSRTGYIHFRPSLRGELDEAPPVESDPAVEKNPDAGPVWMSPLRLVRSLLLFWIGYFKTVRPALEEGAFVVADRWGYGYVGQPAALRYRGSATLAQAMVRCLPRPDLVVLLSATPRAIVKRKGELSESEIEDEIRRWRTLPVSPMIEIVSDRPPAGLADQVGYALVTADRHVTFRLGDALIQVPSSRRGELTAGLALYSPVRARALAAVRALSVVDGLSHRVVRSFLGRSVAPAFVAQWAEIAPIVHEHVGPVDAVAFAGRRQVSRGGVVMLAMSEGEPVAFVKLRSSDDLGLAREIVALSELSKASALPFAVPTVITHGEVRSYRYLVTSPLPRGPHGPAKDPPLSDISRAISSALSSLDGEGVPIHGDLAPWNLRLAAGGGLWLIDWEDAASGPIGADEAYYRAAEAAMGRGDAPTDLSNEIRGFWGPRLEARLASALRAGDQDTSLLERMLRCFQ